MAEDSERKAAFQIQKARLIRVVDRIANDEEFENFLENLKADPKKIINAAIDEDIANIDEQAKARTKERTLLNSSKLK